MAADDELNPFHQMIADIVAEERQAVFEGELVARLAEDALNTDQEATAVAQFYKKLISEGVPTRAAERFTENFLYTRAGAMSESDDDDEEMV